MKALLLSLLFCTTTFASPVASLSTDKISYQTGESAVLRVSFNTAPENEIFEFDAITDISGTPITLNRTTKYEMYGVSSALSAGEHSYNAQIVIQDKNYANSLKDSVTFFTQKILQIEEDITNSTDPQEIADLEEQKAKYISLRSATQQELSDIRTVVQTLTLPISVQ